MATLTEEILIRIEVYGGVQAVIFDIEAEWKLEQTLSAQERSRINALGKWSSIQLKNLKAYFKKIPMQDLERLIGKSENAIYHKVRQLKKPAI